MNVFNTKILSYSANKKVQFVYLTNWTFVSDAFLSERDAHFVRDADLWSVMYAFGACMERIVSPITAQLHHLSLICKPAPSLI